MEFIKDEEELTRIMDEWMDEYYWNRIVVTGISRTGKTTFLNKYIEHYDIKSIHSPDFLMSNEDSYMFFKYSYIIDRWYPWDQYVLPGDREPIIDDYTHDILVVMFLRDQFIPDGQLAMGKRTEVDVQRNRYLRLARRLENSGKRIKVVILK